MASSTTRVKTALYVDFDNIYLGLREDSPAAAEQFATAPDRWLRWMEEGMGMQGAERAVLVRRCYLNPDAFSRYRAYFTRSGFSVVDCPSLTKRGKSSSDIVMVMDMLDALQHETRFDEFVIMSADADFTPVLQRLRMHDRRTAVLVSGMAAPAYRAGCDLLISEDTFIESALGIVAEEPAPGAAPARAPAPPSASRAELLDAIALRVYEEASANGTLPATDLPRIYREFREFTPTSSWLGFFSLRGLTEAVVARRPELRILEGETTWRVGVGVAEEEADAAARPAAGGNGRDELRRRIVARVGELVAQSPEPVGMARAAHQIIHDFGAELLETHWLGAGTFKHLLAGAGDLPFAIFTGSGGLLYDPERHPQPEERAPSDPLSGLPEPLATFIARVNRLTEAPRLGPAQYRLLFEVIAKELGRAPYSLMGTGKAVRDQCVERGESIARQSVTFVLRGLAYVGYPLYRADRGHSPAELGRAFRGNLVNLLRQAQAEVTDADLEMLDAWLGAAHDAAPDSELPSPEPSSIQPSSAAEPSVAQEDADRELAAVSNES